MLTENREPRRNTETGSPGRTLKPGAQAEPKNGSPSGTLKTGAQAEPETGNPGRTLKPAGRTQ